MALSFNELLEAQQKYKQKQKLETPEKISASDLSKMLQQNNNDNNKNVEKQLKSDKTILESQKKLTQNIDRLNKVITKSALGAPSAPKQVNSGRAEQLAMQQPLDYRSVGQRIKDKFGGRGGNRFDQNSLAYKFGSIRGLAETTGLVKRGSGGFVDRYLAVREEEKKAASVMGKLNPQMKNLSQFGGDESKVSAFYLQKAKQATLAKRKLQSEQERLETLRSSGMSEEEIQRTTGGGQQIQKRDLAATNLIKTDPRYKGESLGLKGSVDLSEKEQENIELFNHNNETMDKLFVITDEENKRKDKADKELLAAVKGIEVNNEGGSLSRLPGKLSTGKKKPPIPKEGLLGGGAGLFAGISLLAGVASIAAVGSAQKKATKAAKKGDFEGAKSAEAQSQQYQQGAFSEFQDPTVAAENAKEEAIRDLQAQAKKGNKAAQARLDKMGIKESKGDPLAAKRSEYMDKEGYEWDPRRGKYAKKGSGFLGIGRSFASKDQLAKAEAYAGGKAVPSGDHNMHVEPQPDGSLKYKIDGKDVSAAEYTKISNMPLEQKAQALASFNNKADKVTSSSADNEGAKINANGKSQNNIVNAPTTITKQTQNTMMKVPVRNQDTSIRSYQRSRFAT
jgi:hypothetical protein